MTRRQPPTRRSRSSDPQPSRAPTVRQVARHARVSTATVSRVVSGSRFVSPEVAARVWAAIRELDYRPNHVARNLRVRTTSTVGVIIPDIQNPFFTSVVRGIEAGLQERRFTLLLANSDGDPERERGCIESLCAERVAGLLIVPSQSDGKIYERLARHGPPIVALDRSPANLDVDQVRVTNEEGARSAVRHLASLGWTRIAFIGGPGEANVAVDRERGYRQALAEAGLTVDPSLIQRADFKEDGGYRAMTALLNGPVRPRAVFVANNLMAMGALHAIGDAGLRVPEDIALALFDDIPWAARLHPPLTAVAQPTYDLGLSAARLLLERLRDPHRPVRHLVLQTTLVVRASCGVELVRGTAGRRPATDPA